MVTESSKRLDHPSSNKSRQFSLILARESKSKIAEVLGGRIVTNEFSVYEREDILDFCNVSFQRRDGPAGPLSTEARLPTRMIVVTR